MIPTTILRHRKEPRSKCSVEPLNGHPLIRFVSFHAGMLFDATGYTLLTLGEPELSPLDATRPLLLLDSNWRRLAELQESITGTPCRRTLPAVKTAYGRFNKKGNDPDEGLATVEALYLAQRILGFDRPELLEHYFWRETFLAQFSHKDALSSNLMERNDP